MFSTNDFIAVELPFVNNVESISLFSFNNHIFTSSSFMLLHCINYNIDVILVQTVKKNTLFNEFFHLFLSLSLFGDHFMNKFCFFVKLTKHLGTDTLPTMFLINFLLFLFLLKSSLKFSLGFLWVIIWVWLKSCFVLMG